MNKKQTVPDMMRAAKILNRNGIGIHGMFVYGFDDDDWQTVKSTMRFAKRARLTSTQFLILTPLPGSAWYRKIVSEKRLLFKDWSLFDAHHVVFQPLRLSLKSLQDAQMWSHKKFYSLLASVRKLFRGKFFDMGLAHYARRINRMWKKKNRTFLDVIDLLTRRTGAEIRVDYKQSVHLD
jgi:radical SAM superfamily enzyme YgiQ (UPF0313 family)